MRTLNEIYSAMYASEYLIDKLMVMSVSLALTHKPYTNNDLSEMMGYFNSILSVIGDTPAQTISDLRRQIGEKMLALPQDFADAAQRLSSQMPILYRLACYRVIQVEYKNLEQHIENVFVEWAENGLKSKGDKLSAARVYVRSLKNDLMPPRFGRSDYLVSDWLCVELDNLYNILIRESGDLAALEQEAKNVLVILKKNCDVNS